RKSSHFAALRRLAFRWNRLRGTAGRAGESFSLFVAASPRAAEPQTAILVIDRLCLCPWSISLSVPTSGEGIPLWPQSPQPSLSPSPPAPHTSPLHHLPPTPHSPQFYPHHTP